MNTKNGGKKKMSEVMTQTIKVGHDTKRVLDNLKTGPRETYDEVIMRVLSHDAEDQMDLSPEVQKILAKRFENVKKGKVMSLKEFRMRMEARRNKKKR